MLAVKLNNLADKVRILAVKTEKLADITVT